MLDRIISGCALKNCFEYQDEYFNNYLDFVLTLANTKASSVNVSFDFHRLNILLLRSTTEKSCTTPSSGANLKLATATLSGAKIDARIGEILDLQVVLGGLQVGIIRVKASQLIFFLVDSNA